MKEKMLTFNTFVRSVTIGCALLLRDPFCRTFNEAKKWDNFATYLTKDTPTAEIALHALGMSRASAIPYVNLLRLGLFFQIL